MNIDTRIVHLKPIRFYWSWPEDGDKWFYSGPSYIGRFKNIGIGSASEYTTLYGWHIWIGPLHLVLCGGDL